MTSVALTGTNHAEDQMVHLKVATLQQYNAGGCEVESSERQEGVQTQYQKHVEKNTEEYAGLLGHACPAGVYEYVEAEVGPLDILRYGV
jgi:electron-transferring-flavoprotein dehydrogenase